MSELCSYTTWVIGFRERNSESEFSILCDRTGLVPVPLQFATETMAESHAFPYNKENSFLEFVPIKTLVKFERVEE